MQQLRQTVSAREVQLEGQAKEQARLEDVTQQLMVPPNLTLPCLQLVWAGKHRQSCCTSNCYLPVPCVAMLLEDTACMRGAAGTCLINGWPSAKPCVLTLHLPPTCNNCADCHIPARLALQASALSAWETEFLMT